MKNTFLLLALFACLSASISAEEDIPVVKETDRFPWADADKLSEDLFMKVIEDLNNSKGEVFNPENQKYINQPINRQMLEIYQVLTGRYLDFLAEVFVKGANNDDAHFKLPKNIRCQLNGVLSTELKDQAPLKFDFGLNVARLNKKILFNTLGDLDEVCMLAKGSGFHLFVPGAQLKSFYHTPKKWQTQVSDLEALFSDQNFVAYIASLKDLFTLLGQSIGTIEFNNPDTEMGRGLNFSFEDRMIDHAECKILKIEIRPEYLESLEGKSIDHFLFEVAFIKGNYDFKFYKNSLKMTKDNGSQDTLDYNLNIDVDYDADLRIEAFNGQVDFKVNEHRHELSILGHLGRGQIKNQTKITEADFHFEYGTQQGLMSGGLSFDLTEDDVRQDEFDLDFGEQLIAVPMSQALQNAGFRTLPKLTGIMLQAQQIGNVPDPAELLKEWKGQTKDMSKP